MPVFAALQTRVNAAVLAHLSNATARVAGGEPFGVTFDQPDAMPYGIDVVQIEQPTCTAHAANVATLVPGATLYVNDVPHTVARLTPDGTGLVAIALHAPGD